MQRKLLLWDIDGTLLLTDGAGMRGMYRASRSLYGDAFRWEGIEVSGGLDPLIFEEALARNGLSPTPDGHRTFHDEYIRELTRELSAEPKCGRALPGILRSLATLRARSQTERDVVQGLLTGNYTAAAPLKLRACGIDPDWFEVTAFGDEGRTRPDLVALALRKCADKLDFRPHPHDVIVIGDTPRDIACAHAHGCIAFSVATGRYSVEELALAGADVVVRDLSDAAPLFALIDGHG